MHNAVSARVFGRGEGARERRDSLPGEPQDEGQRGRWPGPVFPDEFRVLPRNPAQDKRDDHCVVKLPRDRNEVGNQVKWHCKVGDQSPDKKLEASRKPFVAYEPREEHNTVGNEPADCARVFSPSGDEECEDDQRVQDGQADERVKKPGSHRPWTLSGPGLRGPVCAGRLRLSSELADGMATAVEPAVPTDRDVAVEVHAGHHLARVGVDDRKVIVVRNPTDRCRRARVRIGRRRCGGSGHGRRHEEGCQHLIGTFLPVSDGGAQGSGRAVIQRHAYVSADTGRYRSCRTQK